MTLDSFILAIADFSAVEISIKFASGSCQLIIIFLLRTEDKWHMALHSMLAGLNSSVLFQMAIGLCRVNLRVQEVIGGHVGVLTDEPAGWGGSIVSAHILRGTEEHNSS